MDESILQIEALLGRKVPADFVQGFRRRERDALSLRVQPMKGAEDLLRCIKVDTCVASNAPVEKTINSLFVANLLGYFQGRIFSSYDIGSWKPAPDIFLHAAAAMACEPRNCVVVEDSVPGIRGALAAGMRVYALCSEATDWGPFDDVQTVSQLSDLLQHEDFRAFVGCV